MKPLLINRNGPKPLLAGLLHGLTHGLEIFTKPLPGITTGKRKKRDSK